MPVIPFVTVGSSIIPVIQICFFAILSRMTDQLIIAKITNIFCITGIMEALFSHITTKDVTTRTVVTGGKSVTTSNLRHNRLRSYKP